MLKSKYQKGSRPSINKEDKGTKSTEQLIRKQKTELRNKASVWLFKKFYTVQICKIYLVKKQIN